MPSEKAERAGRRPLTRFWIAMGFFGISSPKPGEEWRAFWQLVLIGGGIAILTAAVIGVVWWLVLHGR